MFWLLLILLFIAAAAGIAISRGRQMGELARRGVPITGVVVQKFRSGKAGGATSRGRRLSFEYKGPDGRTYHRAASVTSSEWEAHEEGGGIELVCLPDNPGISAPAWLVQQAREALAKRG
jgi:L-ascorbate metabolism protein UlaG (beta-lactamase superfamily)